MVAAFLVVILVILLFWPNLLHFSSRKILGIDRNLLGMILGLVVLSAVNLVDDLRSLSWRKKLATQIVAAVIVALFGIKILWLGQYAATPLLASIYSLTFVAVWLVFVGNVVNWLDSINGLAGGVSVITLGIVMFLSLSLRSSQQPVALVAAVTIGVTLAFLIFNLRGKVFMGDTGSFFLGFVIGVLAIISGGKVATAGLVLAIPFLDAVVVVITRLINRQSPFLPDNKHLTHRLINLGWPRWMIVGFYYMLSLSFGLVALNTQMSGKLQATLVAAIIMATLVVGYNVALRRRGCKY